MPAFDVTSIDGPYIALGNQQNRAFAVPPAMGVDYRAVNGYIYITANPVTDPAKIAERAEFFTERAGYYYANWDDVYAHWREKMVALIAEITALEVPGLPEYEPDGVLFDDATPSSIAVLGAYRRALHLCEMMWQHHFQLLLLGYGAYLTFSELCKAHLPDIPDQHIAQMITGVDVLLFRPDAELRRLAKVAVDTGIGGVFSQGRTPQDIEAELAESEAGRDWLAALEAIKDPWFNMGTGDGLYHYFRSWLDDPAIPYASLIATSRRSGPARTCRAPTEAIERERDRLAAEYSALLDDDARASFTELLGLSRTVFPYVEEHKFYCDYWSSPAVQQRSGSSGRCSPGTASWPTARTCSCSTATRCSRRSRSSCCRGRPAACRRARTTGRRSPPAGASCSRVWRTGRRRPRSARCPTPSPTRWSRCCGASPRHAWPSGPPRPARCRASPAMPDPPARRRARPAC